CQRRPLLFHRPARRQNAERHLGRRRRAELLHAERRRQAVLLPDQGIQGRRQLHRRGSHRQIHRRDRSGTLTGVARKFGSRDNCMINGPYGVRVRRGEMATPYRGLMYTERRSALAFWLGSLIVAIGVVLHLPMYWMARNMGFVLAGMPMDVGMYV